MSVKETEEERGGERVMDGEIKKITIKGESGRERAVGRQTERRALAVRASVLKVILSSFKTAFQEEEMTAVECDRDVKLTGKYSTQVH